MSLFSPDYFWLRQITARFVIDSFDGSFEKHGVDVYRTYYRQLEDTLGEGKYLNWTVEDGWFVARYHIYSLQPGLLRPIQANCRKGNLCAPFWINRYRTSLFRAAMHHQRLRSALRREERRSFNRPVSMSPRRLGW